MKRFTWWRMEQNAPHNAWERWCPSCSILHHVKRFISQPPNKRHFCRHRLRVPLLGLFDIFEESFFADENDHFGNANEIYQRDPNLF